MWIFYSHYGAPSNTVQFSLQTFEIFLVQKSTKSIKFYGKNLQETEKFV